MTTPESTTFIIVGLTKQGKKFRPSDWAERLAGAMSSFRPGPIVDEGELQRAVVAGDDLVQDRRELLARPAPCRPEIHQHGCGQRSLDDIGLESGFGGVENVVQGRHGLSRNCVEAPIWRLRAMLSSTHRCRHRLMMAATENPSAELPKALFEVAYQELRRIARGQRRSAGAPLTLDTTALVHEVYLKLQAAPEAKSLDRAHLLSLAARAMRQGTASLVGFVAPDLQAALFFSAFMLTDPPTSPPRWQRRRRAQWGRSCRCSSARGRGRRLRCARARVGRLAL